MLKNIPIVDIDIQIHYEILFKPKEVDQCIKNIQLKYEIFCWIMKQNLQY